MNPQRPLVNAIRLAATFWQMAYDFGVIAKVLEDGGDWQKRSVSDSRHRQKQSPR